MAAMLVAAIYSRGGFSLCLAGSVRRFMVPGGSKFDIEPGTIDPSARKSILPNYQFWMR